MNNTYFLFCLLVVGAAWAESENGYDLNAIFRTPKDPSRNFDHFEILERNNFENHASPAIASDVIPAEANPLRSVANAQVMLRFGGDDIHDCNCLSLPARHYPKIERDCDWGLVRPLPCERPALPLLAPLTKSCYSSYSDYLPLKSLAPYASTPYAFPGCYYKPRPILPPMSPCNPCMGMGHLLPGPGHLESVVNYGPSETIIEEDFIDHAGDEIAVQWRGHRNFPYGLGATEIIEEAIPARTWLNGPAVLEEDFIVNTPHGLVEETIVETAPYDVPIVTVSSAPEVIEVENPCPKEVSYVEVNLGDAHRWEREELPAKGFTSLVDQALIPFTRKSLLPYPVIEDEITILPEEDIEIIDHSGWNNWHHGPWSSWNGLWNPRIPYGKRFSKDVDSLFEVISPKCSLPYIPSHLYKEKFETMPLKTWSPLSLLAPKWFPKLISSPAPCSTAAPLASTTIISSPTCSAAPSCAKEVVEVKESPCLETVKEVVEVADPCGDSITEVVSTPYEVAEVAEVASPMYSTGFLNGAEFDFPYGFSHGGVDNLYLDGWKGTHGLGYYGEPLETIVEPLVYKQPSFWDVIKMPYPTTPIIEREEIIEPYGWNTLPRYDTVAEIDIAPVAEVIPATNYMYNGWNNAMPLRSWGHGGYFSGSPLGIGPYAPDWPFLNNLGWKETLSYPNYMYGPSWGKYGGEIDLIE